MDVVDQVVVLWAVNNGYFDNIAQEEVAAYEEKILTLFATNKKLKDYLTDKKEIDDYVEKELERMFKGISGIKGKPASMKNTEENATKVSKVRKVPKVSKVPKAKTKRTKK